MSACLIFTTAVNPVHISGVIRKTRTKYNTIDCRGPYKMSRLYYYRLQDFYLAMTVNGSAQCIENFKSLIIMLK